MTQAYVRLARPEEFDRIVEMGRKAFVDDPVLHYFACLQSDLQKSNTNVTKAYISYLLHSCWLIGGRITVAAIPEDGEERIVAASLWLPPNKRVKPWNVLTLLRAGFLSVAQNWGIEGMTRMGVEYSDVCFKSWQRGYKVEEEKGSVEGSWNLQAVFTDAEYQKRGMMSLLVKEGFENAPTSIFTLEATTEQAREHFTGLGFELLDRSKLGAGQVDRHGFPSSGHDAGGVEFFSMVNWNRKHRAKA